MSKLVETVLYKLPPSIIYYSFKLLRNKKFRSLQELRNKKANEYEYSLKGFDDLKCIFVHIPKTGGVSLKHSLFGNLGGGHRTISEYYLIFSPKEIEDYYKFTIARNPWDRIVSAYYFLKEGGFKNADKEWFEENIASFTNFEEFVCKWVNKSNIYTYYHFIPQYHFITHRNKLRIDKFYKLENISKAVNDINYKLNLDISLPHMNKTTNRKKIICNTIMMKQKR